jgi:hypothetical protein
VLSPPTLSVKKGELAYATKTVEDKDGGDIAEWISFSLTIAIIISRYRPIKYMDVEEGKGIRRDGALSPRHSVRQRLLSNSNT